MSTSPVGPTTDKMTELVDSEASSTSSSVTANNMIVQSTDAESTTTEMMIVQSTVTDTKSTTTEMMIAQSTVTDTESTVTEMMIVRSTVTDTKSTATEMIVQSTVTDTKSTATKMTTAHPLYFTDYVDKIGQVESDGKVAMKFKNKCIVFSCPFKVVWVGVLLKNGLVHTGAGIHSDIVVTFENGTSKKYQYMVLHAATDEAMKSKVYASFGDYYYDIYHGLADAFSTKFDYNSFVPVIAGDTWKTNKCDAEGISSLVKHFLEVELEGLGGIHFSVSMYLCFAGKDMGKWKEIVNKNIHDGDYKSLLHLKKELDAIKMN
uniref:Uncharacterized protein n=1 Tax=Amphimedon queenslandica TaxID=400682 RepID=A0A1X7VKM8_AMPQE